MLTSLLISSLKTSSHFPNFCPCADAIPKQNEVIKAGSNPAMTHHLALAKVAYRNKNKTIMQDILHCLGDAAHCRMGYVPICEGSNAEMGRSSHSAYFSLMI